MNWRADNMDFDTPTLTYDEEDYGRTPPNQKAIFMYEWLRNLEDNITTVKKVRQQEALIKFSCFFIVLLFSKSVL